jgi:hypothetical protein
MGNVCRQTSLSTLDKSWFDPTPFPQQELNYGLQIWLCCWKPYAQLELHNSKNSREYGHGLINLFPHRTRGTNGFHFLLDFTCATSHNSPFTYNTNKWRALSTTIFIGNGILDTPFNKLELTLDGPSLGTLLPYSTTFWVCVLGRVCMSKLTKLSSYPND